MKHFDILLNDSYKHPKKLIDVIMQLFRKRIVGISPTKIILDVLLISMIREKNITQINGAKIIMIQL